MFGITDWNVIYFDQICSVHWILHYVKQNSTTGALNAGYYYHLEARGFTSSFIMFEVYYFVSLLNFKFELYCFVSQRLFVYCQLNLVVTSASWYSEKKSWKFPKG